ncbi:trypsin-like serine peptidase [Streptomyces sp. NRRL S-350]|uniref:trypsin-like serine peptidase n=1 Tax=Streptomyces sp. NRRL S-350 TaxID=1463902 RepID=UPI0004C08581|nr:trypsin-like peptidase domain-containing protein [Streptomyces sp. NRRL S-350]
MPTIHRSALAAAVVAGTLVAVSACGPDGPAGDGGGAAAPPPSSAAAAGGGPIGGITLPSGLPTSLLEGLPRSWDDLKKWKFEDWDTWASKHVFNNPVVKDFWDPDKMGDSKPAEPAPPAAKPSPTAARPSPAASGPASDDGVTDPDPPAVKAVAVPRPYTGQPSGKVFFSAQGGRGNCSATVITDPQHPGRSNLVWTAGHCVHEGKGGSFYKDLVFVPAYNNSGASSGGRKAPLSELAPLGTWWADQVTTSPQWMVEGGGTGGAANQYDFAVMRVRNQNDTGKSLEETVGSAVPVWFDAPRDKLAVSAVGYPLLKPFDGQELYKCDGGKPARLSFDAKRPSMLTIGCTMTQGSSGGGWFATMPDGRTALVSNTSIGTQEHTSLSGPYLETVARQALDWISRKP